MAANSQVEKNARKKMTKSERGEALTALLYILPALIVLAVFRLYPFVSAFYISLHNWGIVKELFVGFKNYATLFSDAAFWQSLQVTLFYVVATVPFTMALGLMVAYLLFQKIKFRSLFRTLYFLPYVTSLVPAATAWMWIFNYQAGVLNYVLQQISTWFSGMLAIVGQGPWIYVWLLLAAAWLAYVVVKARQRSVLATMGLLLLSGTVLALGILFWRNQNALQTVTTGMTEFFPVKWLQEPRGIIQYLGYRWGFTVPKWANGPSMALVAVSVVSIWNFLGYDIVIYLAGLGNVPSELYEAARIDGASESQVFWNITLPLLSPTTYFLMLISTIGAFRAFTLFFVMTGGGPLRTTTSVAYFIFDRFWNATRAGYASSAAFVLLAIILALTFVQQRVMARRVIYQ